MIEKKKIKENIYWILLAIFTSIGIILTTLAAFIPGLYHSLRQFKTYLHFTFQANLMGLIISILIIQNKKSIHIERFKVLAIVSLFIAGIVFWAIILPKRGISKYTFFSFIGTVILHGINPVLAILGFWQNAKNKKNNIKLNKYKTTFLLLIYPMIWLIVAIIVYYTINYPIYSFLNFDKSSIAKILIYVFSIAFSFILFTNIFIYLNNKYI